MPLSEAKVPVNDRSFLFGDSIYEVIATRHFKPFFTRDHLERMRETARSIYMEIPWTDDWFRTQIRRGLDAINLDAVYVRIIVSRGSGDFNIDIQSTETEPQAVFIFKPLPFPGPDLEARGLHLAVPETRRNAPNTLSPAFKTGNYLNNIMCLHEAKAQGADDALILDLHDHVTEATTSNIFIVKDGAVITAPLDIGVLHGITRKYVLQLARDLGLPVKEERFSLKEVYAADEVFVSGTTRGAFGVSRVNDQAFPVGAESITRTLDRAFWDYVDTHLDTY